MNKTLTVTLVLVAVGAGSMAPAVAGTKKTITKTYTASAPLPDPTNVAGGYSVCAQRVPGSFDIKEFKVPAAGKLKVEVTNYTNDWDALLMDADKAELGESGSGGVGGPEVIEVKFKKAQTVSIVACNWAGGPTATVKYVFTYR